MILFNKMIKRNAADKNKTAMKNSEWRRLFQNAGTVTSTAFSLLLWQFNKKY